jgi:hypothetical protein
LKTIARDLVSIKQHLSSVEGRGQHQFHDLEVTRRVIAFLATNQEIGDEDEAVEYLTQFCHMSDIISEACDAAATYLNSIKGSAGRKPLVWFNDFIRILLPIAKQNQIPITIETDRVSGEAQGRFLDLVLKFERLFAPDVGMRSPSRVALAKRISRALADI